MPQVVMHGDKELETNYLWREASMTAPPPTPERIRRTFGNKRGRKPRAVVNPVVAEEKFSPGINPSTIVKKDYQVSKW